MKDFYEACRQITADAIRAGILKPAPVLNEDEQAREYERIMSAKWKARSKAKREERKAA